MSSNNPISAWKKNMYEKHQQIEFLNFHKKSIKKQKIAAKKSMKKFLFHVSVIYSCQQKFHFKVEQKFYSMHHSKKGTKSRKSIALKKHLQIGYLIPTAKILARFWAGKNAVRSVHSVNTQGEIREVFGEVGERWRAQLRNKPNTNKYNNNYWLVLWSSQFFQKVILWYKKSMIDVAESASHAVWFNKNCRFKILFRGYSITNGPIFWWFSGLFLLFVWFSEEKDISNTTYDIIINIVVIPFPIKRPLYKISGKQYAWNPRSEGTRSKFLTSQWILL